MRKIGSILLFIFLTGLFTGLFFSTCLSTKNTEALSALLLTGITTSKTGFLQSFLTSLLTNFMLFFLMLPALLSRCLCPLPPLVLWYKSFAIGFCSGLVWMGARSHVLLFSLLHILPQNLFLIPGFFLCALAVLSSSLQNSHRRYAAGRPFAGNFRAPYSFRRPPQCSRRIFPCKKQPAHKGQTASITDYFFLASGRRIPYGSSSSPSCSFAIIRAAMVFASIISPRAAI